ncbi:MAG: radical SAM protein [bacterium]
MDTSRTYRTRFIQANKDEYGDRYTALKWASGKEAHRAAGLRQEILSALEGSVHIRFKGTKPHSGDLSPGCEICGDGTWSCLFINGRCNCRCFYCPTEQKGISVPMTNTVPFPRTGDYVDYIGALDFKGVSISGGEPLVTLPTTLSFISAVKKRFADTIHVWLYTNGTLATQDILAQLRDAGLDEIRFNIGASGYDLEPARLAMGAIGCVTVEIPAVPEDYDIIKGKLLEMQQIGIHHLNLHQLRLTPYNYEHLAHRNYTFLHGEKVTVLESESAALNLMRYAIENAVGPPINYCSFVYKNRFQRAAARRRSARLIRKGHEEITENGYLRTLCVTGPADELRMLSDRLRARDASGTSWCRDTSGNRLYFGTSVWGHVSFERVTLMIGYSEARILPSLSYRHPFVEVALNRGRTIAIEKVRACEEMVVGHDEIGRFEDLVIRNTGAREPGIRDERWRVIEGFEFLGEGLQEYY